MLDVGAGDSPWKEMLDDSVSYLGLDIANASDFGFKCLNPEVTYYLGKEFPFSDEQFSAVICIETLEHAKQPDLLLAEINRVLRVDGRLLLTVPWSARRHHVPFDYWRFSADALEILLRNAGFTDIKISPRGSDVHSLANKSLMVMIKLSKSSPNMFYLLKFAFALLVLPVVLFWFAVAWTNNWTNIGSIEDPLGYSVSAIKSPKS